MVLSAFHLTLIVTYVIQYIKYIICILSHYLSVYTMCIFMCSNDVFISTLMLTKCLQMYKIVYIAAQAELDFDLGENREWLMEQGDQLYHPLVSCPTVQKPLNATLKPCYCTDPSNSGPIFSSQFPFFTKCLTILLLLRNNPLRLLGMHYIVPN